jgi:hypothetical protein
VKRKYSKKEKNLKKIKGQKVREDMDLFSFSSLEETTTTTKVYG